MSSFLPLLLFSTLGIEVITGLTFIVILLACSALISGSEVAFFSLTYNDFHDLEREKSVVSDRILHLSDRPRKLLATILISNNFVNIAIAMLADFVIAQSMPEDLFTNWSEGLRSLGLSEFFSNAQLTTLIRFLITVVSVTFLLVLFGEVAPKVYAKIDSIRLAKIMATPLTLLMRAFHPISRILVNWTNLIEKKLAARGRTSSISFREDIDDAIELTVRKEQHVEQEIDILKSIVKFGDVSVKQIMRSRVDVVAVDFRTSFEELVSIVRSSGYSRIPIYDNDFDNVTGILYVKDLIGHIDNEQQFEWQQLIRTDVLYVPEAKKINDLLRDFQKKHLHMAIVVDEYGGSSGIVTLEDVLEEVIGDIRDEFDQEQEMVYKIIDEKNVLFEGKTLLNDVCRVLNIDTTTFDEIKGDSDSLAGLILEIHGRIPKKDKEIHYNHFVFKIVSVSKRRIERVLITLTE